MAARISSPTIADLYLAFRQAKTALFFEKRGVGLIELAAYEQRLPTNLRLLEKKLRKGNWFDDLPVGEAWIVPKRLRADDNGDDGVVHIGRSRSPANARAIDVQLRLTPHPEFVIAEVLYLWRFGGILDGLLLDEEVIGYRLDLRDHQVVPHRRWLFEYWPTRYQEFRTAPLAAARDALNRGEQTLVINADLASFYDTVEPSFMLGEQLVTELGERGAAPADLQEYRRATVSLLRAYERYRNEASRRAGLTIKVGIPIGALTSRVVANLSLAPLDKYISSHSNVLCYRRYVDDLIIVAKASQHERKSLEAAMQFLPLLENVDEILRLDVDRLGRAGSELQLQKRKVRVHHLFGEPGIDFIDAVASDFSRAVSERRAFVDSETLVGDGVTHLIRAGKAEGSPLRVLRDADRARLERFSLSTSLHSLERVSSLIGHDEARELVRGCLERIGRVLDAEGDWVADLDVTLRLLKLAIGTGDWASAMEMRDRMDLVWGTVDALRGTTSGLYYRDQEIKAHKTSAWTWLRNYLHARRLEAIVSALPIGLDAEQVETRIPKGLVVRTQRVGATTLRRKAEQLAAADLRSRDREDDAPPDSGGRFAVDRDWLRTELHDTDELNSRFTVIDEFLKSCEELGDRPWIMPAARLFLCTRPPSYFDIARRLLYRVEESGFSSDVFERLLKVVNAVRGTEYRDPIGYVFDERTVWIDSFSNLQEAGSSPFAADPRVILGNLPVSDEAWRAAAMRTGYSPFNKPLLTRLRLLGVATVLEKASRVARGRSPAVLVLPELSLPRRWFRAVSNHVVRLGRYGLVAGLEYLHDPRNLHVHNQVFAVLPGPFASAATWPWTKRLPAREEELQLANLRPAMSFAPASSSIPPRTVVKSPLGSLSVLICSELIEARRVSDLLGRVNLVLCPSWNTDTASYDHLIQSVGFQLHSIIAIANNGHYSDCRAWAPRSERWKRDLCRLIERDVDDVVHVDIPLSELIEYHNGQFVEGWRPLPPDWP